MGIRISGNTDLQLWARRMANGDIAVALYNKNGNGLPPPPPIPAPPCNEWVETANGFYEPDPTNNVDSFAGLTLADAKAACCSNDKCAAFSWANGSTAGVGSGYYKGQTLSYLYNATGDYGYAKPSQVPATPVPPIPASMDVTLNFGDLELFNSVSVYDIWNQNEVGVFKGSFTAKDVPHHGTAFLRLTPLP